MKSISVLGDSISTFSGWNPEGYAVYYTEPVQALNGLQSAADTWWAIVLDKLNAELCVNNSYSGSWVSGSLFPSGVSDERLKNLRDEGVPDIILIYMGMNDYANSVPSLRNSSSGVRDTVYCFEDAYDVMLERIRKYYPDTIVVCSTLLRPFLKRDETQHFPEAYKGILFEDYNTVIRTAAGRHGCLLADNSSFNESYETLDGLHPTAAGHRTLAKLWIRSLMDLGV